MTDYNTQEPNITTAFKSSLILIFSCWFLLFGFYWSEHITLGAALFIGAAAFIVLISLKHSHQRKEYHDWFRLTQAQSELATSHNALDQKERIIEKMIDTLPDPLIFLNAERKCLRLNHAAREIFPYLTPGWPLESIIRDPDFNKNITGVLEKREAISVPLQILTPVSTKFEVRILPIASTNTNDHNNNSAILLAMQDITKAEQSEAMRSDFVANVSHELRTPLSSLIGFSETLLGPAKDDAEAREQFLGIMQEQAQRMMQILDDLLSLSRIEVDEHARPKESIDIKNVIRKSCDTLRMKAESLNTQIITDFPDHLPAIIGDEGQLIQVFQNLIDNAIKYGSRHGQAENSFVKITVSRNNQTNLIISIQDQGDGIPREALPRLTERFYRVDAARSRKMGGTGLGLAIVKHIINRHRGRLHITSEIGVGSNFSVILPLE